MADTPVGVRGAECGEPLTPDRSAGVQQGREWFVFLCDHEEYHGDYSRPWPSEVGHTADEYTECSCGRPLRAVRVVEAVSPEPREGEQEKLYCSVCGEYREDRYTCRQGGESVPESEAPGPLRATSPDPSVASVLRLTASRLRDPEYRWSVDPAVTLERLAEKLEKDDSLAEARGFTDAQVERLAGGLWAYEGDPAVDWKGVTDPQFGRQGEAVRLRAKAEVLLRAVFPKSPFLRAGRASFADLPTDEEDR